jgi:hypothetical protein
MVAVRNLLSSLNNLAQSGLLASGWRLGESGPVATNADACRPLPEEGEGPYADGGVEPPLDELLDDPVIQLMMRADRLEPDQVRLLLTSRQWPVEP